jgi:glycine/D-amino acid oxidase-like deaminating enzyme
LRTPVCVSRSSELLARHERASRAPRTIPSAEISQGDVRLSQQQGRTRYRTPAADQRRRRAAVFTSATRELRQYFELLLPALTAIGIDYAWDGVFA